MWCFFFAYIIFADGAAPGEALNFASSQPRFPYLNASAAAAGAARLGLIERPANRIHTGT